MKSEQWVEPATIGEYVGEVRHWSRRLAEFADHVEAYGTMFGGSHAILPSLRALDELRYTLIDNADDVMLVEIAKSGDLDKDAFLDLFRDLDKDAFLDLLRTLADQTD